MPIPYADQTLATNADLTSFDTPDSLAQAYVALNTRVKAGGVDLLPEELAKDPAVAPFKTLSDLAKGYVSTKKMVGGIENAPEKPEDYKFNPVTGLHANVKAEGIVKALAPIFQKAGVGNKAADAVQQGLLTQLSGMMVQQEAAKKEMLAKNETELRSVWGSNYDAKMDHLQKTWQNVGGKGNVKESGIENIKALEKLTSFLSEDSLKSLGEEATLRGEWGGEYDARIDNMQKIWKNVGGVGNVKESGIENIRALAKLTGFLSEDSLKSLGEEPKAAITDATAAQAEIAKYTAEISATGGKHDYYLSGPKGDAARKKMNDLFALMQPK